jgi:hypothetical protein
MVSANTLSYLDVRVGEKINLFLNFNIPSLLAGLLESEESKIVSFVSGYLQTLGVDITTENEIVLSATTLKRLSIELSDAIVYLHDDIYHLKTAFPALSEDFFTRISSYVDLRDGEEFVSAGLLLRALQAS